MAVRADTINMVIAGMALKGAGGASQQLSYVSFIKDIDGKEEALTKLNRVAGIAEIVPNKHRGAAQALLDIVTTPWSMFGGLAGTCGNFLCYWRMHLYQARLIILLL